MGMTNLGGHYFDIGIYDALENDAQNDSDLQQFITNIKKQ